MSVVLPVESLPADPGRQPETTGTAVQAVPPEQIRVAIHVGNYNVDTSLAAHAPLSIVMEGGLVPFLAETLRNEAQRRLHHYRGGLHPGRRRRHAVRAHAVAGRGRRPRRRAPAAARGALQRGLQTDHRGRQRRLAEFNAVKFASFTADTARTLG